MNPKIGICLGVAHACGSTLNYFILTDRGKVIIFTTVQHPMATEVQNSEVQQPSRYYHANMHAVIGAAVVIDLDSDKIFVYRDDPRGPI